MWNKTSSYARLRQYLNVEPTSPIGSEFGFSCNFVVYFINVKNYKTMEKKITKSASRCGIGKNK
jgi:hypothetical protein